MKRYILVILIIALIVRGLFIGTYFTGDAIDTVGSARNYVETGRAMVYITPDKGPFQLAYTEECPNPENKCYFNFTHPPMRVALYSLWAAALGFSNATMMLLPILLGIISIFLVYLIGREMHSENVGLIAAALASVLRYHVYSSVIGFGDNFLMVTVAASFYLFILYMKTQKPLFAAGFLVFTVLGFLTKLSVIASIIMFVEIALIYNKSSTKSKKNRTLFVSLLLIISSVAAGLGALYFSYPIAEHFSDVHGYDFFGTYIKSLTLASVGSQTFLNEKIFYILSFAWQWTPFFAVLLCLALIRLKKDRNYKILFLWIAVTFAIGFLSSGQDFQRLMIIALTPGFILVAKLLEDVRDYYSIILGAIVAASFAVLTGLNDMLPYYKPAVAGFFFLLAIVFVLVPKREAVLVGAAVGLSIFFLFGTSFLVNINSSAVQQLTGAVLERDYPYKELWTTRDISLYLAPPGQPSFLRNADLNEVAQEKYLAFYSIYEENKIIETSKLCEDEPFFAVVNGKKVGIACKISGKI